MTPGKRIRVLSICDDDGIRVSRELVLKQEGYDAESAVGNELPGPDRIRSFHIAVLCHTISHKRAAEITEALRKHNPSIAVLRVHAIRSTANSCYDADCEVFPGPGQLLQGMEALCSRLRSSAAGAAQRRRA